MTSFYGILLLLCVGLKCMYGSLVYDSIPIAVRDTGGLVPVGSMATHKSHRSKRGLLELAGAIKCSTGRSALSYMMYGCYCGLGGQGWPRDQADWCCHKHDCCYGEAEVLGCKTKTRSYHWTCEDRKAECEDPKDKCDKMLCKCDREAAKCLGKAPFISKYALWPDFMCGSKQPMCSIY